MFTLSLKRRQNVSILLMFSLIFSFCAIAPMQVKAGFLTSVAKSIFVNGGALIAGLFGASLGAAMGGGVLGAIAGGLGAFVLAKKALQWITGDNKAESPATSTANVSAWQSFVDKLKGTANSPSGVTAGTAASAPALGVGQDAYNKYQEAKKRYAEAISKGDSVAAKKAVVDGNRSLYDYHNARGDAASALKAKIDYDKSLADYNTALSGKVPSPFDETIEPQIPTVTVP
ncbi:MAG: hypothetical protein WA705_10385 [Candidatus Ozemobacteraceae bacterium]